MKGNDDYAGVVEDMDPCNVLTAESGGGKISERWLLDSGCTYHMCPRREWFNTYKTVEGGSVRMGNDSVCQIVGVGNVRMMMYDRQERTLSNIRHVLDLTKNLLSLRALEVQGCKFIGEGGGVTVTRGSVMILKGERVRNLYSMIGSVIVGDASAAAAEKGDTTRLWHMCLGHMSEKGLQVLHGKGVLPGIKSCKLDFCEFCIMGRQRRASFSTSKSKTMGLLDLIHTDVWRPSLVLSVGGARYYVTFIDDHSRKLWVYILKQKSEVFSEVQRMEGHGGESKGAKGESLVV